MSRVKMVVMAAFVLASGCGVLDVVEQQAVLNAPFEGPGWDAKAGRPTDTTPRRVIVAGTHLMLPNKLEAHRRFFKVMGPIREALKTQPGLIGYATRVSTDLSEDWTMSVWENEEAMYEYVSATPHTDAMDGLEPYATGGWVTHFEVDVTELPIRLDDVIARIKEEGRKAYPNVADEPR